MTLALQLYSMRDCADQIALLGDLPAMGITQVEGYGGLYGDPTAFRAAMDKNGITMPSGHMGLDAIDGDFDGVLSTAKTLGISRLFTPYLDEKNRPDTSEGYVAFAGRLQEVAKRFADHGIAYGWHNHDFEFVALKDGSTPMDIILEEALGIAWEADLAWIVRGGRDPLEYVQRFGNRLSAVHVKDIAPAGTHEDQDGWCDLGAGTMDWAALLQACRDQSSDLIYALEHDKPSDPVGYAKNSAAAFKTLWEATHDK